MRMRKGKRERKKEIDWERQKEIEWERERETEKEQKRQREKELKGRGGGDGRRHNLKIS